MAIANSDGSVIITTKLDVTPVSKALNALKEKFDSFKEQRYAIQALTTAIKDQQFAIKNLEKEYAMLVVNGKGNSTNAEELKARIAGLKEELQQLTVAASAMGVKTAAASTKAAQGIKQFGKRIAGIVKSALIFSVLYKLMQSVVKLFKNILMSDDEFRQDWEELKEAFYAAAYPIVNLIVPAIQFIVQQVRDWAVSIGKIAAALQGMSYSELVDQAKASKEAADNYSDMEKSSKKTANNVKKQIASFDDIQILSSGKNKENRYDTSAEKFMLYDLMTFIGGVLSAVGLILLLKGQISWGIGFIVTGAAFWSISEIWGEDYDPNSDADVLNNIMQTIGVSLAAVGIILMLKGIISWGIGFVVAGAAFWAIGEIWGDEDFDPNEPQQVFEKIMETIEVSLMAVGIILLLRGLWQWGLGFLVAGAIVWGIKEIVTNWDDIVSKVQKVFDDFGGIIAAAGAALIVLGIILCCTGVGFGLGIGLIVAGAAAITGAVVANWDEIVNWVKGAWEAVKGFWNKYIAPVFTAKFWLDLAKTCGNGLITGFESAVNGIIWLFEKMINFVVDGLNFFLRGVDSVISAVGNVFGQDWSVATIQYANLGRVSIPRLAQGAVIPPNREFLAVLGDQKQGTNIEAPADLIKQKVMEAMIEMGGNFGGGNTEVVLEVDGREFGRAVVEQGDRENRRIGTRLVVV